MNRWLDKLRGVQRSPGLLLGLGLGLLLSIPVFLSLAPFQGVQLTLADLIFLREGGPMLGTRPARGDILLIAADERSHRELGTKGKDEDLVEKDTRLYALLLEQEAKVVADTRLLFEDSAGVKEILDGMVALEGKGATFRDIRAETAPWFAENRAKYLRHIAHNQFNLDSGYDLTQNIRYYPILGFKTEGGLYETMALKIAKAALGLPMDIERSSRELVVKVWGAELKRLGLLPAGTDTSIQEIRDTRSYLLGPGQRFPWLFNSSKEAPTTVLPAVLWTNYVGPPGTFTRISYVDALKNRLPEGYFKGKIVIIAVPTIDTYPVPTSTSNRASTGEIVANVVQNLIEKEFFTPQPLWQAASAVVILGFLGGFVSSRLRPLPTFGFLPGILLLYAAYATWRYRSGVFPDMLLPPSALILSAATVVAYRYGSEERARRRIYNLFGRYVPRLVVEQLVERPEAEALALGGTRQDITVLFADIRGFTSFSEKLPPEEVLGHLNSLLKVMVECAFRYQGTVDKYIGDAIMVIFNAPVNQEDHALRAVRAALEMQQTVQDMETGLAFGIGINTGDAVVGNVGTSERLEYTAIGSTVNLASRLCDAALREEIVISEGVYEQVKDFVEARERLPLRVKGIDRELVTYSVSGLKKPV